MYLFVNKMKRSVKLSLPILLFTILTVFLHSKIELQATEIQKLKEVEERNELEEEVSEIRNLPFKERPEYQTLSGEELEEYLKKVLKEEYPKERLEGYQKALVKLGLLEPGVNLEKLVIELYHEQAGGLYDDKGKRLLMRSDLPLTPNLRRTILSHELTHALQDQNFDLTTLPFRDKDNDDLALANIALIEGDAMLVTQKYYLKNLNLGVLFDILSSLFVSQDKFSKAPYFLRENIIFPYLEGMKFTTELFLRGGWKEIDRAYTDWPQSTEQILHPEKYYGDRDEPTSVSLPDLSDSLGEGWTPLWVNVLGEFNTKLLLAQFLDLYRARKPSEGWDGDRYQLLEDEDGKMILIWLSIWDSEKDSQEFFDAYIDLIEEKYGDEDMNLKMENGIRLWESEKIAILLRKGGKKVITIEAPTSKLIFSILSLFPEFD